MQILLYGSKDFSASEDAAEKPSRTECQDSAGRTSNITQHTLHLKCNIYTNCLPFVLWRVDLRREWGLWQGRSVQLKQTTVFSFFFNLIPFHLKSSPNNRHWQKAALSQFVLFNLMMWRHKRCLLFIFETLIPSVFELNTPRRAMKHAFVCFFFQEKNSAFASHPKQQTSHDAVTCRWFKAPWSLGV